MVGLGIEWILLTAQRALEKSNFIHLKSTANLESPVANMETPHRKALSHHHPILQALICKKLAKCNHTKLRK